MPFPFIPIILGAGALFIMKKKAPKPPQGSGVVNGNAIVAKSAAVHERALEPRNEPLPLPTIMPTSPMVRFEELDYGDVEPTEYYRVEYGPEL